MKPFNWLLIICCLSLLLASCGINKFYNYTSDPYRYSDSLLSIESTSIVYESGPGISTIFLLKPTSSHDIEIVHVNSSLSHEPKERQTTYTSIDISTFRNKPWNGPNHHLGRPYFNELPDSLRFIPADKEWTLKVSTDRSDWYKNRIPKNVRSLYVSDTIRYRVLKKEYLFTHKSELKRKTRFRFWLISPHVL